MHIHCGVVLIWYPDPQEVNVNFLMESYENDGVAITMEWAQESSPFTYQVSVDPQVELNLQGSTGVELKVPYNTPYTVSVVATHSCGLNHVTTSIALYYGEHYLFEHRYTAH